jgi:hypothetical protein
VGISLLICSLTQKQKSISPPGLSGEDDHLDYERYTGSQFLSQLAEFRSLLTFLFIFLSFHSVPNSLSSLKDKDYRFGEGFKQKFRF